MVQQNVYAVLAMAGKSLATDIVLTILTRLLETSQQIDLHVYVVGILRELNFTPGLRPRPPPRLPVAQNLLLKVDDLEVGRHPFETIRFVNVSVDVL